MNLWDEKPYYSLSHYYKNLFGEKVYKIALNANLTCPNRDGKIDSRGCLFCSEGGSGEFASSKTLGIVDQIEQGKIRLSQKKTGTQFVAYFQAFTNTYGNIEYLKKIYYEACNHPDIVGISIATRPDCLDDNVLRLLEEVGKVKKLWVELGLQTIHEKTALLIRRGYELPCYDASIKKLNGIGIEIIVHLIIGLPFESREDLLKTVDYVTAQPIGGIKLQLLHVLEGTDLAKLYRDEGFPILSLPEYSNLIVDCIERIPSNIVIHRITGDGPKELLIVPQWSLHKKVVLNTLHKCFKERDTFQGKLYLNS